MHESKTWYANDVASFATELKLGPVRVLGHSMGGRIGVRLGHSYPKFVSRLIIADPPVSGAGCSGVRWFVGAVVPFLREGA